MSRKTVVAALGAAVAIGTAVPPATAAETCPPRTIALPTPAGYEFAEALAFGDTGVVGGTADRHVGPDEFEQIAVLWRDRKVSRILGEGFVGDINEQGAILRVGSEDAEVIRGRRRIAVPPLQGDDLVFARRLNARGDVSGSSAREDAGAPFGIRETPVIWRGGTAPVALPLPDGFVGGWAAGLNDRGDASGLVFAEMTDPDTGDPVAGPPVPVMWPRQGGVVLLDRSGYGDEGFGIGFVIDNHRRVGGAVGPALRFGAQAAIWSGTTRRVFGPVEDRVFFLGGNNQGQFAGGALPRTDDHASPPSAVVAEVGGTLLELRPLSGDLADGALAHAVSKRQRGDVAIGGGSENARGEIQATIWTCALTQGVPYAGGGEARPASGGTPASNRLRRAPDSGRIPGGRALG